jgi:SAM-dependent methyltransferase
MMIEVRIDQINPSLLDHNYIERVGRVRALKRIFEREYKGERTSFTRGNPALLLDLGGGESPYERLAHGLPVRWISGDIKKHGRTDVIVDAHGLPFRAGVFDAVLCTQVIGCVPNLYLAAEEIYRVLKPRGTAILTEAAVFPPYGVGARWRILPEGWKTLLSRFSTCDVSSDCKTVASFFRIINLYLAILLQNIPIVKALWRFLLCPLFNLVGRWANGRFRDIGFSANYIVVAKK